MLHTAKTFVRAANYYRYRPGLPDALETPTWFLTTGRLPDEEAQEVRTKVEGLRARIAAQGDKPIEILYSPKPGSAGSDTSEDARPSHGERLTFTAAQVAKTGKDPRWGMFLHLCARSAKSKTIIELGSCAGISAAYLAASPYCERLITIEGSEALANLARETLSAVTSKAEVKNALFDDALDDLLPTLAEKSIDMAFIDGHHEKVATLHYFNRLKPYLAPKALVAFDDISWSKDMRECWQEVERTKGFSHTIDYGRVGIGVWKGGTQLPIKRNFQPVVGRIPIGVPKGWQED